MKLVILYDNGGFSCFVKTDAETLLFDTGCDGKKLLSNMEFLNLMPEDVDAIFISHAHFDHTGGLFDFIERNPNVRVYVLKSFPSAFKTKIKESGADLIEVEKPVKLNKNLYSTGELGARIKEQSLIIDTPKGLVILTGCSHPGVVTIAKKAIELHNKQIYLLIGGFHIFNNTIANELKLLGVKNIIPCHCSGMGHHFGETFEI